MENTVSLDVAKIESEIGKLMAETSKLNSEATKLMAEHSKLIAEAGKLNAESRKFYREVFWIPVGIATAFIGTVSGATVAIMKLLS